MKIFIEVKDEQTYTYENVKIFDYDKHFDTAYIINELGDCVVHEDVACINIEND